MPGGSSPESPLFLLLSFLKLRERDLWRDGQGEGPRSGSFWPTNPQPERRGASVLDGGGCEAASCQVSGHSPLAPRLTVCPPPHAGAAVAASTQSAACVKCQSQREQSPCVCPARWWRRRRRRRGQEAGSRVGGTQAFSVPKLPGFLPFRKEPLPCHPPSAPFSQRSTGTYKFYPLGEEGKEESTFQLYGCPHLASHQSSCHTRRAQALCVAKSANPISGRDEVAVGWAA